jgi:predicted DCC family thiol-disulfide oxidoreductase YuxK
MKSHPAVLIFDGDCGFCTSTSNFIKAKSSTPIEIHPWQFIDVGEYGLTQAQVAAKVYFVAKGVAYSGHEAFAQILIAQRNVMMRAIGHTLMAPPISWLARPGYWLVAKFRHKLPGGTPACKL